MNHVTAKAKADALKMILHFQEDITENLLEMGSISDDLFKDYPDGDSIHHDKFIDESYTLLEAAKVLDFLEEYEEDDSELWGNQSPTESVCTQAAYTYGNAVLHFWGKYIGKINEKFSILNDNLFERDDFSKIDFLNDKGKENQDLISKYEKQGRIEIERLFAQLI